MTIFDFDNYRTFLIQLIKKLPKRGHGQLVKFAKAMNVHPSIVTLVLKGKLHLTLEQATELADYLGLSSVESDYFINLVSLERAGTEKLRVYYLKTLNELKSQRDNLKKILPDNYKMNEETKAVFYSQWYYSAIRLLVSLKKFNSTKELAERCGLPLKKTQLVLDFLIKNGLCIEKNGTYEIGPLNTQIGNDSLLVTRHHSNWRQRAINTLDRSSDKEELFFTSTAALSKEDLQKVKNILLKAVENSFEIITPSPSEEVFCLNIDWFRI